MATDRIPAPPREGESECPHGFSFREACPHCTPDEAEFERGMRERSARATRRFLDSIRKPAASLPPSAGIAQADGTFCPKCGGTPHRGECRWPTVTASPPTAGSGETEPITADDVAIARAFARMCENGNWCWQYGARNLADKLARLAAHPAGPTATLVDGRPA